MYKLSQIRGTLMLCAMVFGSSISLAGVPGAQDFLFHKFQLKRAGQLRLHLPNVQQPATSGTFQQTLNPDDPRDTRTFAQRYFLDSSEATGPNSPVLYYICGEGECSADELGGALATYAAKFHAHMIALEHRFYGQSQPFSTLAVENLKYLSAPLALGDLARFQDYAMKNLGLKGKWIVVGGSYAGAMSAFYRMTYPEKVVGSLASSGPVLAKANFEEYDLDVAQVAGPVCLKAIQGVTKTVQDSFSDPTQLAAMKHIFGADQINDNVDFIYTVADMAAGAIQYGMKDEFCNAVTSAPDENSAVQAYAQEGAKVFNLFNETTFQDSTQYTESTDISLFNGAIGARQWFWQSCTEFGYWQVAYHDPSMSARSPLITLDYNNEMCKKVFGVDPVNTDATNALFYNKLLDPNQASNILLTNGSTDPWHYLSMTQENGNATNQKLSYFMLQGGSHCSDLGTASTTAIQDAQNLFEQLATGWLN